METPTTDDTNTFIKPEPTVDTKPIDGKCTSCGRTYKISYDSDWLELKLCEKCTQQLRDSLPEQLKHPQRRKSTLKVCCKLTSFLSISNW